MCKSILQRSGDNKGPEDKKGPKILSVLRKNKLLRENTVAFFHKCGKEDLFQKCGQDAVMLEKCWKIPPNAGNFEGLQTMLPYGKNKDQDSK